MTCDSRDYQKSKVYAWEDRLPKGKRLAFAEITDYASIVWAASGLKWPPLVELLHKNDRHAGKANRTHVWFPTYGAVEQHVLHELAHSMTGTIRGHSDAHGPQFVGVYVHLLCRHLNVPLPLLLYTLDKDGIQFDLLAKAWCGR